MLVVVSDLHFEEEASDFIEGSTPERGIAYSRNLPGRAFQRFVSHLAEEAKRNGAKKLDFVLAGDIFDIHRTSLWFRDNRTGARPYVNNSEVAGDLEDFVLKILASVTQDAEVRKSLRAFRMLGTGRYWDDAERTFPVPATLHYLPGNHDRLLNASPAIRSAVREALGLEGGDIPFPHALTFQREGAIVRHGHEYDRFGFAEDYGEVEEIPLQLPDETYDLPVFGDFATVEIASRLPSEFRRFHGDQAILREPLLRSIYLRLLELDDLRPLSAMLHFLLQTPGARSDAAAVWAMIEPVIINLLDELHDHPFMLEWLEKMDQKWRLDVVDVVQTALALRSWRLAGIPLRLAQFTAKTVLENQPGTSAAITMAAREQGIRSGEYRFLVAGHTHRPGTHLLAADDGGDRYYIDTGTWRNQIPATQDFREFGRLKALSYVVIYGPDEDLGTGLSGRKIASLDFWSGVTRRWQG